MQDSGKAGQEGNPHSPSEEWANLWFATRFPTQMILHHEPVALHRYSNSGTGRRAHFGHYLLRFRQGLWQSHSQAASSQITSLRLLQRINSFLTDRSFCVKVDQTLSLPAPVYSGVPHGSVLGPLLFLVYINDLVEVISSRSLLYAYDLKIWTSDDRNVLQEDIINVKNWSISWNLPINDAKCAHMSLGGTSANRFIIHDDTKASDVVTLDLKKDLGVRITTRFSFKHHHSLAAKKSFGVLNMIKRTFPRITHDDFEQLYATYVRRLLEYASSVIH